jgi:hypothetical protein
VMKKMQATSVADLVRTAQWFGLGPTSIFPPDQDAPPPQSHLH